MPRGVRYKLGVAFFLMALIPLFVCAFFILAYIYPETRISFAGLPIAIGSTSILVIMAITVFIALLGLMVMKEIIDPVVRIASQAKKIAEGKLEASLEIGREDEVGDLSDSLNRI